MTLLLGGCLVLTVQKDMVGISLKAFGRHCKWQMKGQGFRPLDPTNLPHFLPVTTNLRLDVLGERKKETILSTNTMLSSFWQTKRKEASKKALLKWRLQLKPMTSYLEQGMWLPCAWPPYSWALHQEGLPWPLPISVREKSNRRKAKQSKFMLVEVLRSQAP